MDGMSEAGDGIDHRPPVRKSGRKAFGPCKISELRASAVAWRPAADGHEMINVCEAKDFVAIHLSAGFRGLALCPPGGDIEGTFEIEIALGLGGSRVGFMCHRMAHFKLSQTSRRPKREQLLSY